MAALCSICLKATNKNREPLHVVTLDGEAKLQFGYYSYHGEDLNRPLFNTAIHDKCYHKYFDRWYNKCVRKMKGGHENEVISISNENNLVNERRSSNVLNVENHDYDGDVYENNDNDNETFDLYCSTKRSTNEAVIRKKKSPLIDISNIIHSPRDTISISETHQSSHSEELLVQDVNVENYDLSENSLVHNNINYKPNGDISKNGMSNYDVLSSNEIYISSDINAIESFDLRGPEEPSDRFEEESSCFDISPSTSMDIQTNLTRSRARSMHHTSTPKVLSNKIKRTTRRRRRSEEGVIHPSGINDRSLIYDSPLHELQAWLKSILGDGRLIPLIDVQQRYEQLMKSYNLNDHHSDGSIRCDVLRKQLESKFPDQYHFETVSKRNGTYIALNDISLYSRAAIRESQSSTLNCSDRQQSATVFSKSTNEDQVRECEILFSAIRFLRSRMKDTLHVLETLYNKPELMTELTNDLFADCVPLIIRNFTGLLTASNRQFDKFQKNHVYYEILTEDIFRNSPKSLKNTVICHDILNARHDHIVTPKHVLLANEICKHGRSNELLSILNRFGHVASYKTISRIHRKIANNEMMKDSLPTGILQDCYLVQVADNFDLNRETLHGERSYHFLNRIFVQTSENSYISNFDQDKNNESSVEPVEVHDDSMLIDVLENTNSSNNQLCSTNIPSFDTTDTASSETQQAAPFHIDQRIDELCSSQNNQNITIKSFRLADDALRDHSISFYHDYEPFIDHSLQPHLLAYGFIKAYFNRLGQFNLPLYSGFMAIHLPNIIRPRHKVTYMPPINEDPNKLETAETCMMDMKQMLVESGVQNDAVLVVDERIFRLCMQIKDENWSNFENIFLYPGDFHMMKCSMIVIWNMLEESGIDTLIGYLYKGATLRAVLTVAHFNKSLRTIKLLYTALLIILHNEYVRTLSTAMLNEIEQIMQIMPPDLTDAEKSREWYTLVLDYLSKSQWQYGFDQWIQNNCQINLKFRFWIFVLYDLITPLIKLYTSLRTSNFNARNAAVCELAELFFVTNHRQYARLTARHLSDLRVCSENLLDRLAKSFAVTRTNRNFSSIALDQTIEVTINKMGKGHGGITGRCSADLIDIWSNSFSFRCLLSSVTRELAGVESASNSVEAHIECSSSRMQADQVDLQIILDKLDDEKLFSLDTNKVTQILTGKIIHQDIIESICQSRTTGAQLLKTFIRERLVNCSTPLNNTLHASSLLNICDNDTYESTRSSSSRRSKKKPSIDFKKIEAEIRRVLVLSQYRSIDLASVFGHEFSPVPLSLCSLDDTSLLNQQSKSKDTFDFLKEKFPLGIHSTYLSTLKQKQALVVDASSLLHINPRAGSTVFEHSIYFFGEHIIPLLVDYSRVDLIFDSSESQQLKSFTHRHGNKNPVSPKYDKIPQNSQLPTGKAYQNFVVSNRARLAAAIVECWKDPQVIQKVPFGSVLVVAGPDEVAIKLEKDQQPVNIVELESNHIEADSRLILHIDQLIQSSYSNIVVKSIDTDVTILCIYYASLPRLENLLVDATVPKKTKKIIDCTYIHNQLIDKYYVNPLQFLVIYALSGCDTCSFIRNVSKKKFMQTLLEAPADFTDLENLTLPIANIDDIAVVEKLFIRCFNRSYQHPQKRSTLTSATVAVPSTNQKDITLNELRANMAMVAFKQNKTSIVTSLPPTQDALFHHCLRVCRQIRIWLQAPDAYINYPDVQDSGFEMVDGRLQVKWISKLPISNDHQLSCCGKHKGQCTRCICIIKQIPCTIYCQCSIDCPNRNSLCTTTTYNPHLTKRSTTQSTDVNLYNSRLPYNLFYQDYSSEEENTNASSLSDSIGIDIDEENNSILSSSQNDSEEFDLN